MCGPYNGTSHEGTLPAPPPQMQEVCRHFHGSRVWGCGEGRGHLATLILAHWGGIQKACAMLPLGLLPVVGMIIGFSFCSLESPLMRRSQKVGVIWRPLFASHVGTQEGKGAPCFHRGVTSPRRHGSDGQFYGSLPWEPIIQRLRWSLSFLRNTGTPPLQGLSSQLDFL